MDRLTGFIAYPNIGEIAQPIRSALEKLRTYSAIDLDTWEEHDIAGRFLIDPILANIRGTDIFVADITHLNFNVTFEIGYAISQRKRVFLVQNKALSGDKELIREVGLFDTLGYKSYENSQELFDYVKDIADVLPLAFDPTLVNQASPVYLLRPRNKTDLEIQILSRIKKARLQFRSFDAEESGRLSASEAIESVCQSYGVLIPLLPKMRREAKSHNLRAAFIAGFTFGLDKTYVILQQGEDPVPLDYRDLVHSFQNLEQISPIIADFAADVGARFQKIVPVNKNKPQTLLERLKLGASAAENELLDLNDYYLETDEYRRALKGEIRIITGRKGAGKTALFAHLRNNLRGDRKRVVVDLKPDGFQLLKFREKVLDYLAEGTRDHTITAFWEYLLLLETCYKLLEKDRELHIRDSSLFQPYRDLAEAYESDPFITEGDFSERMLKLTQRIADDFALTSEKLSDEKKFLSSGEITELLYKHDLADLRTKVFQYLQRKNGLWILFDNLDKGWPPNGVTAEDVLSLKCLVDALGKLERDLKKNSIEGHGIIFIRNDVFELLVKNTSDRGKTPSATIDWTDTDLLRELLRRRFACTGEELATKNFEEIWRSIARSHINGEETSQYLIERSLMRPRAIIELIRSCRSHAVNLGHDLIETGDIEYAEEVFSNGLLMEIDFELRDVFPSASNILYEFIEANEVLSGPELRQILQRAVSESEIEEIQTLLLWYGFLGIIRDEENTAYIYSVKYNMSHLTALIKKRDPETIRFRINPAFRRSLEIK